MAMPDEVDTSKIAVWGVVGAVAVLLIVFVVQIFYYELSHDIEQQHNDSTNQALARYYAEQNEKLHRTGWVDQSAGKVSIPIERAMELTLRDLNNTSSK